MSNDIRFRALLDDKVSSGLQKISDKVDMLGPKGTAASLFGNVGAKAAAKGFSIVTNAVDGFVGVLGDAVSAAMEDEHSQSLLGIALKDNVPAWDGNTAAIEKVLKARIDLAFSDEEQRISLATLTTVTHNVTKALDLERGAMDIARARGVDLATATNAVAKAYSGNLKTLKALIPGLDTGKDSTEALGNAFQATAGQADAYLQTVAGKLDAAQHKLNEKLEDLGYRILPVLNGALDVLDGTMEGLSGEGAAKGVTDELTHLGGVQLYVADTTETLAGKLADDFVSSVDVAAAHLQDLADQSTDTKNTVTLNTDAMVTDMASATQDLINGFFDPIETNYDRLAAHAKVTAAIHAGAKQDIITALDDEATTLTKLGTAHKLTAGQVETFRKDVTAGYKKLGIAVPADLQLILDKLDGLSAFDGVTIHVKLDKQGNYKTKSGQVARAAGGPVSPWEAYTVGEHGPETLVMGSRGGGIVPNGRSAGGSMTFVYSPTYSSASPAEAERFARSLTPTLVRELRRQGVAA